MPLRTLIVEDSVRARDILKRRLEEIGCAVVGTARDAAAGLTLFRAVAPQLVTLDLMLPFESGSEAKMLLRTIR